jgi:hypothetical protein
VIAIATLLAEHPPAAVSRALMLIAEGWHDANFVRWIDAQRILAEAWHKGRLADAKARLAAGERAPVISVVGFRWNSDWTIYEPSDGIHRTVAARDVGRRIKAKITGYYQIKPQLFIVWRKRLWRLPHNPDRPDFVGEPNDAERAALLALGVQQR